MNVFSFFSLVRFTSTGDTESPLEERAISKRFTVLIGMAVYLQTFRRNSWYLLRSIAVFCPAFGRNTQYGLQSVAGYFQVFERITG